ncbi:MAG: hypothetical protein JWM36_457 [Hyphomicrobiales bacterium]|nr:hypothetical protein [Hyphomicrobiales bacterium]
MADDVSFNARTRSIAWRSSIAGLAALAAGLLAGGSAQAQVYGFFDTWHSRWGADEAPPPVVRETAPLRRADINAMLGNRGYQVQRPIERNGDVFIADTIDPRGRSLRVVVDAYDGSILERFPGALPRPSVGLRDEDPRDEPSYRPTARGERFLDQDRFDNADRFDEQRAVRERVARPSTQDLDQRYIQRLPEPVDANGEPRVIRGVGPQSARPATPPKAASNTTDQTRKTVARTGKVETPAPRPATRPAAEPKPLASEASKPPVQPPVAVAPAASAPQTAAAAPRVIPLYKAPPDVSPEAARAEAPKVIPAPVEAPAAPSGD